MGLLQLLLVATAILATSTSAQKILDVEDPVYLSDDQFSSGQIEDRKKDPGFYEDYDFNSNELAELLKNEPDSNDYEQKLDDLMDSINSEEVELEDEEEEEEDHFLHLLNILEELEDTEEDVSLEDPIDPEDECDDTQCSGDIISSPNLDEDAENGRRQKRSPALGFRSSRRSSSSRSSSSSSSSPSRSSSSRSSSSRSSSPSRSSSSRSSSSRSSSSRSSSSSSRGSSSSSGGSSSSRGSSSSGGGWWSRRGSSGSSRGSGSTSGSRGSTSSSSSSGGSTGSSSGSTSSSSSGGSTGSSSGSTSGSSTGTAVLAGAGTGAVIGAGTGAAIGAASGSSNTGSKPGSGYPVQPSGGYPTGTQPAGGYPTGTQPVAGYPTGTQPRGGYPTGTQPASGYPTGTQPAGGYPTGTQPVAGYPTGTQPSGGYPTGTQPVSGYPTGTQPAGGYPTGTQPVAGYPTGTRPSGGYPTGTQPAPGYPTGTQPVGGYPTGTQPGGYPTGTRPSGGYPTGTQPAPGYPTGTHPVGGYPTGTQPGGYPTGTRPVGGYPTGTQPVGGYPTGTQPGGGYPTHAQPAPVYPGYSLGSRPFGSSHQPYGGYPAGNQPYGGGGGHPGYQPYGGGYSGYQPSGGYPTGTQSFGGFPTGSRSYGGYPSGGFSRGGFSRGGLAAGGLAVGGLAAAGGFAAAGGYPAGGYPMPKRKKSKKEKVVGLVSSVATAYAIRKAHKKNKFLSPFGHSGSRGMGIGGGLAGAAIGMSVGKTAKKILGAYVKIQIAKYALKYGAKAAEAYFEYKLGRELDEYMIGKFVHRYHQHRVRGSSRWRHRTTYYEKSSSSNNETDNVTLGEFCHRPCNESIKLICQFSIEVHLYQTLSRACYNCPNNITDCERPECVLADGTRRMVVAVNKAIPGPPIEVCEGDKVLVDVLNNLPSTALTLHWHGLTLGKSESVKNARATPFMDGAPGVTQCPIAPGSAFRYSFDATDAGTHFWHAQTGLERGDGVFGPFIVHQSMDKVLLPGLPEHIFVVNDWFHSPTQVKYVMKQNSGEEAKPKSILINGQGRHKHDGSSPKVPYFNFIVEKDMRYRLRIINAAATNCPVTISLDSHYFILLSVDGSAVSPVNTSTILVHPGERYDAMFKAEQDSGDDGATFWIRVDGGNDCQGLEQFASVQYLPTNLTASPLPTVAPNVNPSSMPSTNPGTGVFTGSCDTPGQRCLSRLRSSKPLHQALKTPKATYTFYLSFTKRIIHNENFYSLLFYDVDDDEAAKRVATPQINYLTFRGTSTPLLVNQRPLKSENCSSEGVRRGQCTENFCECLHLLQVPVGAIVDLVLIGEGNGDGTSEPVHLHGYKFWVLAQVDAASVPEVIIPESENITLPEGMSREKVMRLDDDNRLERYLESPVIKDTIAVPPGGYAITRIAAENIGFWVLESQVLFNSQAGMSLVLQVGAPEDLPKAPKDFPTC